MAEYIPKYPSKEGDDSNKTSSQLLAETLKPIYVPQDLMLAWETHLASYSRDTHVLLDQVKDSETALNTQYQALLARVQKYEQMLQDITMDSNEFTMDTDEVNFTGWNILAQASYWDYLLKKEITKLSDKINGIGTRGELVSDITDEILEGLVADNNYISNVIEALSNTPLIQELDAALNTTSTSLSDLQAEYVRLAEKQVADATQKLNQSRDALLAYQNKNEMFDPETQAKAVSTIVASLQGNMAQLTTEERTLLSYLNPDAPQVVAIRSQIAAVQKQIDDENAKLTSPNTQKLNRKVADFEELKAQVTYTTDLYKISLASLEKARLEASRKLKKLVVISTPRLAQDALYPRKVYISVTVFILLNIIFGIGMLVHSIIREHRE